MIANPSGKGPATGKVLFLLRKWRASSALKIRTRTLLTVATLTLAAASHGVAEEPTLSVYATLRANLTTGDFGEVVLKVNNPPGRDYYVLGSSMTDVPFVTEILWNGKWTTLPQSHDIQRQKMRPLLAGSYLLFPVLAPPLLSPILHPADVQFRFRAFLYKDPVVTNPYLDLRARPYLELVSAPIYAADLAPADASAPPVVR